MRVLKLYLKTKTLIEAEIIIAGIGSTPSINLFNNSDLNLIMVF